MQRELGSGFEIIENGLNNRTTNLDYPTPIGIVCGEAFNGVRTLPGLLATHAPLDLVVILLGTNDLKAPFHRTAKDSASAIAQLIALVERSSGSVSNTYDAPQVLIVAPPQSWQKSAERLPLDPQDYLLAPISFSTRAGIAS
jgi:lysophospholipase L1-like esterase